MAIGFLARPLKQKQKVKISYSIPMRITCV